MLHLLYRRVLIIFYHERSKLLQLQPEAILVYEPNQQILLRRISTVLH